MAGTDFFQPHPEGFVLKVFVLPRSSKNMLVGRHGDTLKIKLTAPPVDGAANTLCLKFLARRLGLPRSSLEIVSGHAGRTKLILVRADKGEPGGPHPDLEKRIRAMAGD
ncbi:MAG: DUF167 domain-containing protein [Desulfobacterales bacterium]